MRWNDFPRSLVFGAVAAAGYAPFALLSAPWLDARAALVVYALSAVPIYLAGLGDGRRRSFGAALGAGGLIALALLLGPTPREAIVAATLALSVARSAWLYRRASARAVAIELALGVGGLAVADGLVGGSTLSAVLAIWGFYLVQSVFFVIGGAGSERRRSSLDPFDEARERANRLMDAIG